MPPHGRRRARPSSVSALSRLLLFLTFVVAPALAASSVLGIDLGTEFIKVALVKPGIPLEIVLTKDSRRKEAAALAFKPAGGVSSTAQDIFPERAYGADALALAARFPGDVYPNLKPLLGLSTHGSSAGENPLITEYQMRYPGLTLQQCSADRDTVCLRSNTFAPEEEPFAVEELLAMQLQNVRSNAEAMAGTGNTVKDVVFTVPAYWTVEEKRAVETAAELAGLRVLALTTDGLAVGIHYATTRTFPVVTNGERPEHHLVFDMGAGSATATVLRFQGRSVKDVGKFNKTIQEIQVLGAGWDRTLGGDALNQLLTNDLSKQLAEGKQMRALDATIDDIHRHGRTMAKLWKEAQRLRQILSANTQTQSTIEGLYNGEVSLKYKITRSQFEEMASDYAERVQATVRDALAMARLDLKDLDSVILHGGATRTPLVQKALEGAVKNPDLLKTNVNSDEAAAFGAAFRAAGISPSFRVKELHPAEAAIQPVEMTWAIEGTEHTQQLFVPSSLAGKQKIVPIKSLDDFTFKFEQVSTSPLGDIRRVPLVQAETLNLTAAVKELKDSYGCDAADITANFAVRVSSDVSLPEVVRGYVSCEAFEEKKAAGVMDGVKNLFGFGAGKDEQVPLQDEEETVSPSPAGSAGSASGTASSDKTDASSTKADAKAKAGKAEAGEVELQKKTRLVYVGVRTEEIGLPRVRGEALKRIRDRMKAFDQSDKNRRLREQALNDLEAYAYKLRDLVEDTDFIAASTDALRADVAKKAADTGEWIYGDGADAKLSEFQNRLKDLKALVKSALDRRREASQRDTGISDFQSTLDSTKVMIENIIRTNADRKEEAVKASLSAAAASASAAAEAAASPHKSGADADLDALDDTAPEEQYTAPAVDEPFKFELPTLTEEQLGEMQQSYDEAKAWFDGKIAAQAKLASTEDPAFTVAELKKKAADLQNAAVELLAKQMESSKKKSKKAKKSTTKMTKTKKAKKTSDSSATESPSTVPTGTEGTKADIKDEL